MELDPAHNETIQQFSILINSDSLYAQRSFDDIIPYSYDGLPLRYSYCISFLNYGRYAEQALIANAICCVDPLNGHIVCSSRAYVLTKGWPCIAYEFNGVERFFLFTSNFNQFKIGIWFPRFSSYLIGCVEPGWATIGCERVEELRAQMSRAEAWPAAQVSITGLIRTGVLYLGFGNNVGHYMWNDLSGLEAVIEAGSDRHVDTIVIGPHEYVPIDELFPELAHSGVKIQRWETSSASCVVHNGTLPLRITGNRISYKLRKRIVAWALESCGEGLVGVARYNDLALNLWVNLRLHNKVWIEQVNGIVAIATTMRSFLPVDRPLRLILDGTPDTHTLVNTIADRLDGSVEVINATCVTLAQTVALASLIDLHVSVVGAGLTLPHWLMGRRGVAHSDKGHLGQQAFWNNISEGTHDVVFIKEDKVEDIAGNRDDYRNYQVSTSDIIDALAVLFRQQDYVQRISAVDQMIFLSMQRKWLQAAERVISI